MINLKSAKPRSSISDLEKRGYIQHLDFASTASKSAKKNLAMLKSESALDRSIAAKMLQFKIDRSEVVKALLLHLEKEDALYTRLEICDTLALSGPEGAQIMMDYLGKIGDNQYCSLPKRISKKASYPLPRDIVARTMGKMERNCIQVLLEGLKTNDLNKLRELIDGIGYLCSRENCNKNKVFRALKSCYDRTDDEIVRWKIVIAYRTVKPYSINELKMLSKGKNIIAREAKASLSYGN